MSWEEVTKAWDAVWAEVDDAWKQLYAGAVQAWEASIRQMPQTLEAHVAAFEAELKASRCHLDCMKPNVAQLAKITANHALISQYSELERTYHSLASAFYSDAVPVEATGVSSKADEGSPKIGIAPVLIAAGLAVGVGGAAWAVVAYEYAVSLREQTALALRELEARVEASKAGRALLPSTLPDATPTSTGPNTTKLLLIGGAALAAALLLPTLLQRGRA